MTTNFNPKPYVVIEKKGTMITAENNEHHRITCNSAHFKPFTPKHTLIVEKQEGDSPADSPATIDDIPKQKSEERKTYPKRVKKPIHNWQY